MMEVVRIAESNNHHETKNRKFSYGKFYNGSRKVKMIKSDVMEWQSFLRFAP